jgi:hypothetical protein
MRNQVIVVLATATALLGRTSTSPYADLKLVYGLVRDNLQHLAEQMPEESYTFRPSPEMRSFGELMAHIADTQGLFCSGVQGIPPPPTAASKASKPELLKALKNSSAICDTAFDYLTPANAGLPGPGGPVRMTKLGTLVYINGHSNEEYSYAAVYLRLKGIVPPSTVLQNRAR